MVEDRGEGRDEENWSSINAYLFNYYLPTLQNRNSLNYT